MKTIGERIQQARLAKRMSAWDLAMAVGYKTQSGISNLENKATGSGGHRLKDIARVLSVTVDWLMNGPDYDQVPFLPQQIDVSKIESITGYTQQTAALYIVPTEPKWPFELFDYDAWMSLSLKDRQEFENLIAGAVLRVQKLRRGT